MPLDAPVITITCFFSDFPGMAHVYARVEEYGLIVLRVGGTFAIGILQDMTPSMAFGDDDRDTIHSHVRNARRTCHLQSQAGASHGA